MANEIVKEEVGQVSGVEETQRKRKVDVEKTIDYIVNKRVEDKLATLKESGMFDEDDLVKIAKQIRTRVKVEVQKQREQEKLDKEREINETKTIFKKGLPTILSSIENMEVNQDLKDILISFTNEKLENALLRKVGLIRWKGLNACT